MPSPSTWGSRFRGPPGLAISGDTSGNGPPVSWARTGERAAAKAEASMQGHIKKRATWEYVAELGPQPLQRCPSCRKRFWIKRERLPSCPICRGPLEETVTRRQEMKAGFATTREAQEALTTVMASLSSGTYIEPSRMLTSEFLQGEPQGIETAGALGGEEHFQF